jgi:hypothetical protein
VFAKAGSKKKLRIHVEIFSAPPRKDPVIPDIQRSSKKNPVIHLDLQKLKSPVKTLQKREADFLPKALTSPKLPWSEREERRGGDRRRRRKRKGRTSYTNLTTLHRRAGNKRICPESIF